MLHTPFYDPTKTYEENYTSGPFGAFADGKIYEQTGEAQYDFCGQKVFLPFGIPAGPLLNGNFAKAALEKGFDIVVYKTARTRKHPVHSWPNVLSVNIDGNLTMEAGKKGIVGHHNYVEPLSITNSFGVPSYDPDVWQKDLKKLVDSTKKGQVVVGSFQGTPNESHSTEAYHKDFALAAKLMLETGVKVMEVNLSCPNEGHGNLMCYDIERTNLIINLIKDVIGDIPLVIKISYFYDNDALIKLIKTVGKIVGGVSAVNTLAAKIIDEDGNKALPGDGRDVSGVCGAGIKWAGIDMARRLKKIREDLGYSFTIEGVGGVTKSDDYFEYLRAGADSVMSATGAMWNPYLAQEIKSSENKAMDIINNWHGKTH